MGLRESAPGFVLRTILAASVRSVVSAGGQELRLFDYSAHYSFVSICVGQANQAVLTVLICTVAHPANPVVNVGTKGCMPPTMGWGSVTHQILV
jgi:hypothetical protein